ncbi:MAG: hypothetical protein LAT55_00500 [Opitutales bacterium]|nr:hypothetical protein [Opitutales bacterium]
MTRTPPSDAGKSDYRFDVELSAEGELSGWMDLSSDAFYASMMKSRFVSEDRENLHREVER